MTDGQKDRMTIQWLNIIETQNNFKKTQIDWKQNKKTAKTLLMTPNEENDH